MGELGTPRGKARTQDQNVPAGLRLPNGPGPVFWLFLFLSHKQHLAATAPTEG